MPDDAGEPAGRKSRPWGAFRPSHTAKADRELPISSPSANPASRWKDHARRRTALSDQTRCRRRADPVASRPPRAALPFHWPRGALVGPAVVGRVRDGRDPAGADSRRRRRARAIATPIAFVIAAILAVVVFSYRQTIHAYPSGGGAYIVAKDNIGETPASSRRRRC